MFAQHIEHREINITAQLLTTFVPSSDEEIANVEAKLTEIEASGYKFYRMVGFPVGEIGEDQWSVPYVTIVFLKTNEPADGQLHLRMEDDFRNVPAGVLEAGRAEIDADADNATVIVMYRS